MREISESKKKKIDGKGKVKVSEEEHKEDKIEKKLKESGTKERKKK